MTGMPPRKHHGFTLIELLIVVAIIAILAAIAIPNFLEAQTRSKVSRVKADMRTLATANEAYFVDYNRYAIASQWIFGPDAPQPQTFNNRMRGLTTPVAYITSLPVDIFYKNTTLFPVSEGQPPTFEYSDYTTAVAGEELAGLPSFGLFTSRRAMTLYYGDAGTVYWALQSPGPDGITDFQTASLPISESNARLQGVLRTYDPTNGTVSEGDIARTNSQQRN